jgi:alanyl-tRNA synthetase
MTDRLYYDDSFNREFDALVLRIEARGPLQAVWLDRSSFYPTSGGQPFDTGQIGSSVVENVEEDKNDVVHIVRPAGSGSLQPGDVVHGVVDWTRRFDHMQQHSGQHVLSAAFDRLFGVPTISFHLGADASTIDLAREMKAAEIGAAEDEANRIVWEDRPVVIRYATAEEAAAMPLRKEPVREGTLRLIEIEETDLSACGGTHVNRTGSIGVIATGARERVKGGQRLEFVCGGRAWRRFRLLRDVGAVSTTLLSVLPEELPMAIERLQSETREQKRQLASLHRELAAFRAEDLARQSEAYGSARLVLKVMEGDAGTLKALATAVSARPGFVTVLVSNSAPALVVAARSADVSLSCDALVATLTSAFGGRGGGRPELAQAGGLQGSPAAIIDAVRRALV